MDPQDKTAKADVALSLININLILFNSKTRVYTDCLFTSPFFYTSLGITDLQRI